MKTKLFFNSMRSRFLAMMMLLVGYTVSLKAQTVAGDYTFSNATATYSEFLDGTIVGISDNWDNFAPPEVNIGFPFYFNGNTYTQAYINANGYITFGSVAPVNTEFSPISGTGGYAGAIAAFARDLHYGENNASGRIRYKTVGSSPNRVFVVQWRNAVRKGDAGKFNFQIRLYEGSNTIEIHYGSSSEVSNTTSVPVQVGLRGALNADFNNRTTTTNWSTTSAGTASDATNATSTTVKPIVSSIYRWTLDKISGTIPLTVNGTWTVPCGVTNITVETWGAGGGGARVTQATPTGGGGGGAYAKKTIPVNIGDSFAYFIGSGGSGGSNNKDGGDTWFGSSSLVLAKGGKGVPNNNKTGGMGGQASQSIGDVTFNGGRGADAASHSGGGGGAATASSPGNAGNTPNGGTSTAPGGNGGRGARDDDGILGIGFGPGFSGSNYGGGGGGARSAAGIVDNNGGNGAQGYIRISYSYVNPGTPPPITAIATVSSNPTTDIGCENNDVTLQASGGNTGAGVSTLWYKGNTCPNIIYAQEFMGDTYTTENTTVGTVTSGNRRFKADSNDPMIHMRNVLPSSFNTSVYRYIIIRYRVISGGGDTQIYFVKDNGNADGSRVVSQPLISGGNWHVMTIDMGSHSQWNGSITGWRYDFATVNGTEMDIDYLALSSQPILENTNADDSMITVQATDENTVFGALRIADQAAVCNGSVPVTTCTSTSIHRSDKTFTGTANNNWDNGNNWSFSGVPNNSNCVKIPNGKSVVVNIQAATAKSISVANGGAVTISSSNSLTVINNITNQGNGDNFVVKSDGNLIQVESGAVNTGVITAEKTITPRKNGATYLAKEYNYLSSPVVGQKMKEIFGGNAANVQYVTQLDESKGMFVNAYSGSYVRGKGYAVKEPSAGFVGTSTTVTASFKGVPYNGDFTYNLAYSGANPNDNQYGYNVVGNPYPSNIDLHKLHDDSKEDGTYLRTTYKFWDSKANNLYTQMGTGYTRNAYASYNVTSGSTGTGTAASADAGITPAPTLVAPNHIVKVGQGFMVKANKAGAVLNFKNTQRTADNTGSVFYGKNGKVQPPDDRYWIELITSNHLLISNAVVYFQGGNSGFGPDDTESPGSSDNLFTYADAQPVIINGRSPFANTDVVKMGIKLFESGTQTIRLGVQEGVFANGQSIYLKDKDLGIITDLSSGSYTFISNSGEFTNRFEIIYKPETILTVDNSVKDGNLIVYRDGEDFAVHSTSKTIDFVEVYDMSGRLYKAIKGGTKTVRFSAEEMTQGVCVLKIVREGEVSNKRILK